MPTLPSIMRNVILGMTLFTLTTTLTAIFLHTAYADPCRAPLPTQEGTLFTGTVTHIIDGDSLCVSVPGQRSSIEVRLADYDAPELNTSAGQNAYKLAIIKWLDMPVTCRVTRGRNGQTTSYDRVIATCH
jgi:endonuclease YncB( thermonuclease family)